MSFGVSPGSDLRGGRPTRTHVFPSLLRNRSGENNDVLWLPPTYFVVGRARSRLGVRFVAPDCCDIDNCHYNIINVGVYCATWLWHFLVISIIGMISAIGLFMCFTHSVPPPINRSLVSLCKSTLVNYFSLRKRNTYCAIIIMRTYRLPNVLKYRGKPPSPFGF